MKPWPRMETEPVWCEGRVMHARRHTAMHRFVYPLAFLRVPLSAMHDCRHWLGLFGINRRALFAVHAADHGPRDGRPLLPWLQHSLAAQGVNFPLGEVVLQTFPRLLGYVFNPVSFWFCHDTDGQLRAVLCEVNNTFGEQHNYLVRHADLRPIASGDCLSTRKVFHVSPFFPVAGSYHFRFLAQANTVGVNIEYRQQGETTLLAHVGGRTRPLTAAALLSALLRYPFMTLGVMVRIHWQALHLWRKGARFYRKPAPPLETTT